LAYVPLALIVSRDKLLCKEAVRLTKRVSSGEIGQLRIGFFGAAMAAFLPGLVQEYYRRFPDVDLTLRELTSQQVLEAFDEGQLDVGFSRPLPAERSKEFYEELVYTDYLHLVLPSAHPLTRNLADDGTIAIKRLSGESFVLLHRQSSPGYTTKCSRYAGARASSLRTWSARLTTSPRSCSLWSRASASPFFPAVYVTCFVQVGRWFLPVSARFRAPRVANELAAGRAIVAHSRSFSRSRAEPAGGDPDSDGGAIRTDSIVDQNRSFAGVVTERNV
jgi:DNA-binding transcriptional LysR family regulator